MKKPCELARRPHSSNKVYAHRAGDANICILGKMAQLQRRDIEVGDPH